MRHDRRPWYDQGWVWLLVTVGCVGVLAWLLSDLAEAARATAEATREQTGAIREQTAVMEQQGAWLAYRLEALTKAVEEGFRSLTQWAAHLAAQLEL